MRTRSFRLLLAVAAMAAGLHAAAPLHATGNGVPVNGFPNWQERAMLAVSNACRTGPQQFHTAYLPGVAGILQPGTSVATFPLYWSLALDQSSRAHSVDMATHNCFQHNSCDGTLWYVRIQSYYTKPAGLAENIAAGYTDPFQAVLAWVNDGGALDGTAGAGHRTNILNSGYREMGAGYAYGAGSTYGKYYTEDFGGGAPDFTSPLAEGSHFFRGDGNTTFMASYYSPTGVAVTAAAVVVDGVAHAMSRGFGVSSRGTYTAALATAAACRSYYFRFTDSLGTTWLYPETGQLRTTGEGGCAEDYTAAPVAVGDPPARPGIRGAAPNPFLASTRIRYSLPAAGAARVDIVDARGARVRTLFSGSQERGDHELAWDGRDAAGRRVAAGIYFVNVQSGAGAALGKVAFLGR